MKRRIMLLWVAAALLMAGCTAKTPPPAASLQPTAVSTPSAIATETPVASATAAATPTPSATASPSPAPTSTAAAAAGQEFTTKAMQRDIDRLIGESDVQKGQEQNYKNVKKEQWLTVEYVTDKELKFAGKPQVFQGDYRGQLTKGQKYRYFEDASMGGKRYYNVKDNFGVWIVFKYTVPF